MTVRNPLVLIPGGNPQIQELPAGDTIGGAPQGVPGLAWQGAWDSATSYAVSDAVSYQGSSYIAIQAGTNHLPTDTAYWDVLAAEGATGATGAAGSNGANGTGSGANFICNGRLTLTSGTAVTTADVTGATTIYFTPFQGNQISTYDSSTWTGHTLTEVSLALGTLTSGKNYDVFIYNNSGTLTLELSAAWTSDTARSDAIALQDGVKVKSSDHSRRYLGTIRTTSTTATEDSEAKRYVFNEYSRMPRSMKNAKETTDTWSYATGSYRQANSNTANQLDYVSGDAAVLVHAEVAAAVGGDTTGYVAVGVGVDSTTTNSAQTFGIWQNVSIISFPRAIYRGYPGLGRHFLAWLECGLGSGAATWRGDGGTPTVLQSGITGYAVM